MYPPHLLLPRSNNESNDNLYLLENRNIKVGPGIGIGPESYIDDDRMTQNKSPLDIAAT